MRALFMDGPLMGSSRDAILAGGQPVPRITVLTTQADATHPLVATVAPIDKPDAAPVPLRAVTYDLESVFDGGALYTCESLARKRGVLVLREGRA